MIHARVAEWDTTLHLKEHDYAFRSSPPSGRVRPWVVFTLYLAANFFYFASLRGAASPEHMNTIQGVLGIYLLLSTCSISAQFWYCFGSRIFLQNTAFLVGTIGGWYLYDNGNRLASHGAYNMLVFFMALVPINLIIAMLVGWYWFAARHHTVRWSVLQLIAAAIVMWVTLAFVAWHKEDALRYGFFNKTGSYEGSNLWNSTCQLCTWNRGVPWLDMVPFRLNFWTGPMTCPIDLSFSAKLDGDEMIIENCHERTQVRSYFNDSILYQFDGPAYSILPRTESWGLPLKYDDLDSKQNLLQKNVLEYIERHTYPYLNRIPIPHGSNAVLARCGDAQPKLLHTVGQSAIPPLRSPPLTRPTIDNDRLNVVVLFLDSTSRHQFHRMLPRTRAAIESLVTTQGSRVFEMFRYHTVGLNTGPNTLAMWAGLSAHNTIEPSAGPIWEQFERAGYTAGRIDPMCQDWDAYYLQSSFGPSADSLITTPRISHESIAWSCLPPYLPVSKEANGNFAGAYSLTARCLSDSHVGWHTLDIANDFIRQYNNRAPFYLHATFMEAHEGSGAVLATLDPALAAFLDPRASPSPSQINWQNTAVVIVADHGELMGLRSVLSENGRVSAASPLGVVIVPEAWADHDRRERLENATKRVVTGFDLYETIRGFGGESLIQNRSRSRRGVDLAREVLTHNTCADAGIEHVPCMCN